MVSRNAKDFDVDRRPSMMRVLTGLRDAEEAADGRFDRDQRRGAVALAGGGRRTPRLAVGRYG